MNRARRTPAAKPFVAGGVYDPSAAAASPATPVAAPAAAAATPTSKPAAVLQRNYSFQNTPKKPVTPTVAAVATPGAVVTPKKPTVVAAQRAPPATVTAAASEPKVEDVEMAEGEDELSKEDRKELFKKMFISRKKPSVRAKEKKIRQNRALRKVILPKNALMALHEVKGINIGEFILNSNEGGGFTATFRVNDTSYEAKGNSKASAKNNASEKALRDIVLAKMRQKPRLAKRSTGDAGTGDVEMETVDENGEKTNADDIEDVPMINLASFALYKLFAEWESSGYKIPEFHPTSANAAASANESDGGGSVKEPKKPTIRNELPQNWELMHPATLLNYMRPGTAFTSHGEEGTKPNTMQRFSVICDEQEFVGVARTKKMAKRKTAAIVCNLLFGTNFPEEEEEAAVVEPAAVDAAESVAGES